MKYCTYTVEVCIHASITVHAADANAAQAIAKDRTLNGVALLDAVSVHGVEVGNLERIDKELGYQGYNQEATERTARIVNHFAQVSELHAWCSLLGKECCQLQFGEPAPCPNYSAEFEWQRCAHSKPWWKE